MLDQVALCVADQLAQHIAELDRSLCTCTDIFQLKHLLGFFLPLCLTLGKGLGLSPFNIGIFFCLLGGKGRFQLGNPLDIVLASRSVVGISTAAFWRGGLVRFIRRFRGRCHPGRNAEGFGSIHADKTIFRPKSGVGQCVGVGKLLPSSGGFKNWIRDKLG